MSDLGTIGIVVEVKGRDALRQIQSDMDAVDRSTKTAAQSFAAFERAGLKSANTFKYMAQETKDWLRDQQRILSIKDQSEKIAQKQAQAEAKITTEIVKQRQASEQAAAASARAYQSQIGGNLGLGAQGISAGASASAMEAEIERLRQKYDQVYAASRLYESSLKELNRAHMLGVTSTKQHEAAVESLNLEYQNFQNNAGDASNRFSQHIQQASSRLNQYGVVTQQVGYQVGDFLVQVQSGTNWMVAFGQQATQLVGVLPMMGAGFLGLSTGGLIALSTGLGIAIPLVTALGAVFMRTGENAKEGSLGVETYKNALSALNSEIQKNQEGFLKLKFDTTSSGLALASQEMEDLSKKIPIVRAELDALYMATAQAGGIDLGALFNDEADQLAASLKVMEDRLFLLNAQAEAQRMINGEMSVAGGLNKAAILDKQQELRAAKELEASLVVAYGVYAKSRTEGEALAKAAEKAGVSAAQLSHIAFSNISSAANEALRLAGNLGISLDTATKLAAMGDQGIPTDPSGKTYSGRGNALPTAEDLYSMRYGYTSPPSGAVGSGSGGGAAGNAGLETLINSLQTEREVIDQWYAESQASLQSASDAELAIIGGRHEAELRLEEEHQKRLAGIKEAGNKSMLETTLSGAGEILSALGAFNDKALRISKVFAAAEALVSTYQGAAAELKKGVLGFGTAAAVIAKGIGFVAAIKGVSSSGTTSGTSSGGGRGSATVPTTTAQATPQTVYIDSISPENLYTGQTLINLFEAFYSENDRRGKVFVVGK